MTSSQQQAILTIALLAAFADGAKDDSEREEIRRIADSLAGESGSPQLSVLYQDVLLKRVDIAKAAAALTDSAHKQLAYEMAVCVCDADGVASPAEQQFLRELRDALRLDAGEAAKVVSQADAVAAAPLAAGPTVAAASSMPDAEMDKYILNHAIANGAIELLPQSLATMAIIPLQMKLVYRIGQSYGFEMDKGHIKEFLATAGVGLTSQYVEQFGRKLLGGLLGSVAGGLGRGLGRAATGRGFLVRDDVRAWSAREAVLRGRPTDEHRVAAADVSVSARPGEADAGSVLGSDPAEGAVSRRHASDEHGEVVDYSATRKRVAVSYPE